MRPQGKAETGGPEIRHRPEESGVRSGAAGSLHTHREILTVSVDSLLHPTDPGSLWGSVLRPSLFLSLCDLIHAAGYESHVHRSPFHISLARSLLTTGSDAEVPLGHQHLTGGSNSSKPDF